MSDSQDRREFLKRSAAAVSAAAVGVGAGARRLPAGEPRRDGRALPGDVLRGVAGVVLPPELGSDGIERVARGFEEWVAGYTPVTEQVHGYGSQEIRYGPPDPAPRWTAQLEAFDREARARHGGAFADLEPAARRTLIEGALADTSDRGLPDRPGALAAEHVVVGLLGYFYGSPEATNLCYRRRIDPSRCRSLSASPQLPPAIATQDGGGGDRGSIDGSSSRRPSRRDPAAAPVRGLEPGS